MCTLPRDTRKLNREKKYRLSDRDRCRNPTDLYATCVIGERLSFPAIEPAGDGDEQQPKDRDVNHKREVITDGVYDDRRSGDPTVGQYGSPISRLDEVWSGVPSRWPETGNGGELVFDRRARCNVPID